MNPIYLSIDQKTLILTIGVPLNDIYYRMSFICIYFLPSSKDINIILHNNLFDESCKKSKQYR